MKLVARLLWLVGKKKNWIKWGKKWLRCRYLLELDLPVLVHVIKLSLKKVNFMTIDDINIYTNTCTLMKICVCMVYIVLVHLGLRLKWALPVVCMSFRLIVINFSHFYLLPQNHLPISIKLGIKYSWTKVQIKRPHPYPKKIVIIQWRLKIPSPELEHKASLGKGNSILFQLRTRPFFKEI